MPAPKAATGRERNGRAKRTVQQAAVGGAEVQRLRNAALAGMRDAAWGSTLGWLYLNGKLTHAEFATGKRWCELVVDYDLAMRAPRPPRSAVLERSASSAVDPDTAQGRREAQRHARMVDEFMGASAALAHAGSASVRAVADVCDKNQLPVGVDGLRHLVSGLHALAAFWSGSAARLSRK